MITVTYPGKFALWTVPDPHQAKRCVLVLEELRTTVIVQTLHPSPIAEYPPCVAYLAVADGQFIARVCLDYPEAEAAILAARAARVGAG